MSFSLNVKSDNPKAFVFHGQHFTAQRCPCKYHSSGHGAVIKTLLIVPFTAGGTAVTPSIVFLEELEFLSELQHQAVCLNPSPHLPAVPRHLSRWNRMFASVSNFRDEEELMGLGEGQNRMLSDAMKQDALFIFLFPVNWNPGLSARAATYRAQHLMSFSVCLFYL